MELGQSIPKRTETLIINTEDEQAPSLINLPTGQLLITNTVGKRIVELADGNLTAEWITTQIPREFRGAEIADILQHATRFLAEGEKKGVITWIDES